MFLLLKEWKLLRSKKISSTIYTLFGKKPCFYRRTCCDWGKVCFLLIFYVVHIFDVVYIFEDIILRTPKCSFYILLKLILSLSARYWKSMELCVQYNIKSKYGILGSQMCSTTWNLNMQSVVKPRNRKEFLDFKLCLKSRTISTLRLNTIIWDSNHFSSWRFIFRRHLAF